MEGATTAGRTAGEEVFQLVKNTSYTRHVDGGLLEARTPGQERGVGVPAVKIRDEGEQGRAGRLVVDEVGGRPIDTTHTDSGVGVEVDAIEAKTETIAMLIVAVVHPVSEAEVEPRAGGFDHGAEERVGGGAYGSNEGDDALSPSTKEPPLVQVGLEVIGVEALTSTSVPSRHFSDVVQLAHQLVVSGARGEGDHCRGAAAIDDPFKTPHERSERGQPRDGR